jgi:polysaccharide export outer membrane protein
MNHPSKHYLFSCLAGLSVSLGLLVPAPADDGPVKVRRVPTVAELPPFKEMPRAVPATRSEPKSEPLEATPSTANRNPVCKPVAGVSKAAVPKAKEPEIIVKKADPVVRKTTPPTKLAAGTEDSIIKKEAARARTMQPKAPAPKPKKKTGRVSWTQRYELGPGDTLNFGLHGQPKLVKPKVPVAPDWTISYLQAKQISVRGLTVEELRVRMEEVLADFHRNPKVIVSPAQLGSKKYTVLGKVKANDTYKLDRPTTLLEAIAKAKGIVVGVRNSNATELADLKRSFVVREGSKLDVDIEQLYRAGDMSQNVQIEPGDYIYIASNVHNESYVFGSVARPGTVPLSGNLTVMGAIAESGSYAKYAWKKKVLLVRGSVGNPEVVVIDTRDVLRGKEKDVLLEPGDIVYVHKRPWAYAEEILDIAIKAYIQAAITYSIEEEGSVSVGL